MIGTIKQRIGIVVVWLGLGMLLLITAHFLVNSTFAFYDDEGYVLSTLRAFLAGGRLYDDVLTQYGPWPYVYHQIVTTVLQTPLTHMLGRSLTAVHWVGCTLLCGHLTLRLTGRFWTAITVVFATFGLLWQTSLEPSHPGSHLALLLAVTGSLAVRLPETNRPWWIWAALGGVTALLILTKINVGLLMITGVACIALRFTAWPANWRRPATVGAAVGLLLVAWVLISQNLHHSWPLIFAMQFTLAAAGLLWVTPSAWTDRPFRPGLWLGTLAGFTLTCLVVATVVCLQGTTCRALFEAVVIGPIKQPARFMLEFSWPPAVWPVTAVAALLIARAGWEIRRLDRLTATTRFLVVAVRIGAIVAFVQQAAWWPTIAGVSNFIAFCLPLIPIFLIPLGPRATPNPHQRTAGWMLAFVALPQVLHAFPVAGSQMGWGTFMLLSLFVSGADEAIRSVTGLTTANSRRLTVAFGSTLLAVTGWQFWLVAHEGWQRYTYSQSLGLPGAEDIRVPGIPRQTLRFLTLNAAVHTDMLFSRPGMFSFNIWSGARTPTSRNATHWFWLLNAEEQKAIVAQLEKTPRRGIIVNAPLDRFMEDKNISMEGPLQTHLLSGYRILFKHREFSFLVPLESKAVPFGKVERLEAKTAGPDGRREIVLQANLVIEGKPDGVAVELLDPPRSKLQDYCQPGSRVYLEPINSIGEILGPPTQLPVNRAFRGLFRLTIFNENDPTLGPPQATGLFVRNVEGDVIAEAVF